MKKAVIGLAAVGAVIALRPFVKRRMVRKMREHCRQMAAQCKEMMGSQREGHSEEQMTAQHEERSEPVATL